jgi:hypothetical protein
LNWGIPKWIDTGYLQAIAITHVAECTIFAGRMNPSNSQSNRRFSSGGTFGTQLNTGALHQVRCSRTTLAMIHQKAKNDTVVLVAGNWLHRPGVDNSGELWR